mgnify:CR=1 FL=1
MKKLYPDDQEPPSLAEQYSTAVGTSNLRVQSERRTPADMVIAAGMNENRLGMALRRLATEWDSVGKPPQPDNVTLEGMAAKYPRIKGTGMVLYVGKEMAPATAAQQEAEAWHAHELGLLFQRLKTLPEVRAALVFHFKEKAATRWHAPRFFPWAQVDAVPHIVGAVLQWWLDPVCPACHGVKKKIIAGTGRTSSKDCHVCKGKGERKVPHGNEGRRVLSHINCCLREAVADLKRKFHRRP